MKIENLKLFLEVARIQNLNKAAEHTYINSRNLSFIIKNMEKELGVQLFARSNKGMKLTKDGEEFLEYAQTIVDTYEKYQEKKKRNEGILRIYTTPALADELYELQGTLVANRYYISINRRNFSELESLILQGAAGIYFLANVRGTWKHKDLSTKKRIVYHDDRGIILCHKSKAEHFQNGISGDTLTLTSSEIPLGKDVWNTMNMNDNKMIKKLLREKDAIYSTSERIYKKYFLEDEWVVLHKDELDAIEYSLLSLLPNTDDAEQAISELEDVMKQHLLP